VSQTFRSLGYFNYRLWFAGALVSNVGTWMQRVAQDWLVLTVLTNESGVAVGITTSLQFLPFLLFSAWAGVIADRVDQRLLLLITQGGSAALGLGLGVLVLSGNVELWHVYAFAAALGCVSAFDGPARQVFVARLVPTEGLTNAVGLNSTSFNVARLLGPAVAGFLIASVGLGWVFVINGITYVATIAALLLMRNGELVSLDRAVRGRGQIREGLRYVKRRADVVVIMVIVGSVSMFGLNFQLTSALMARTEFDRGPTEYGILGSVLAIGSVTGALMAAHRKRARVRLVIGAAFGFGVASAVSALMPTFHTYALACIAVGFFALTMLTSANAAIQTTTASALRGRVMALYMVVVLGGTPIGAPIVGWMGETYGARWAIGIGAIASITVSLLALVWATRHWDLAVSYHVHRPLVRVWSAEERDTLRRRREEAQERLREQQIENISGQS
jgi:MFS family permease